MTPDESLKQLAEKMIVEWEDPDTIRAMPAQGEPTEIRLARAFLEAYEPYHNVQPMTLYAVSEFEHLILGALHASQLNWTMEILCNEVRRYLATKKPVGRVWQE